jgi:aminoglycoside phosphotransferase (APT) family kinase protein
VSIQEQPDLDRFLYAYGLAKPGETARWRPLTGGVSSEIWRVDLPERSICVKRALPKLKVAADWQAPISRSTFEWRWLCFAAQHQPQAVPRPLAHDEKAGLIAMSFLDPKKHVLWKSQLLSGNVDPDVATNVGGVLAQLHDASVHRPDLAEEFASLENFRALRIEPYLLATGARHPDLVARLCALADLTSTTAMALVHGDVSPKNILIGPQGPVFIDAECAWYGDPAFDLAFCLNHLLLKSLVKPDCVAVLLHSFSQLAESYLGRVKFEPRPAIERRVAQLLPALMLARVDGKSPVEYLVGKAVQQDLVRRVARSLLHSPVDCLAAVAEAWSREISAL